LVLAREDPVVGRNLAAVLVLLAELLDERLAVCGDRDGILHVGDGVADADLDGAEARVQADVPTDVRVVRDAAGALELADDRGVIGVIPESRWGPGARKRGEHHLPARRETRRLSAPERRARRQREQ